MQLIVFEEIHLKVLSKQRATVSFESKVNVNEGEHWHWNTSQNSFWSTNGRENSSSFLRQTRRGQLYIAYLSLWFQCLEKCRPRRNVIVLSVEALFRNPRICPDRDICPAPDDLYAQPQDKIKRKIPNVGLYASLNLLPAAIKWC